jgi:hypothetical protein
VPRCSWGQEFASRLGATVRPSALPDFLAGARTRGSDAGETLQRIVDALEIFVHRLLLEDQQHTQERRLPALVMRNSLPYLANSALEIFAAAREGRLFSSGVARGGLPSHRPDHGGLAVDPLSRAAAVGWASLAEHGHRGGGSGSRTPVIGKSKCRWHSTFPSGA